MQKEVTFCVTAVALVALLPLFSHAFVYRGGPTSDSLQHLIRIEGAITDKDGNPLYRMDDRVMGIKHPTYRIVAVYDGKIVGSGGALPIKYSLTLFTRYDTLNLWDKDLEIQWGVYDEEEPHRTHLQHCTTINLQDRFGPFEQREVWIDIACA